MKEHEVRRFEVEIGFKFMGAKFSQQMQDTDYHRADQGRLMKFGLRNALVS